MTAESQSITKVHAQDSRLTQVPYITQPLKIDPAPTGTDS
jgi:hypothetical protein